MAREYKTLTFIKNVLEKKFAIPPYGKLILFGVENGNGSIERLCHRWGSDRVIGYDIEKRKHPNVKKLDLTRIGPNQACEISFADTDVGVWKTHSDLRLELLHWCIPQVVMYGLVMTTAPLVTETGWQEKGHDHLIRKGFRCYRFNNYAHEAWHRRMNRTGIWNPNATCIYRRESWIG
jgi:hypothetical protein|tara:strand:+ start:2531 stop:3064 length:534 start_codon:yes stop_codon:yes gene_type:complete